MRLRPQLNSVFLVLALGLVALGPACTNGQVGGEIGADGDGDPNSEGGDACAEKSRTKLSAEAATTLGFTAAEVIALSGGSHTASLAWAPQADLGSVTVEPAAGDSSITLDVAVDEDRIFLVDLEPKANEGGAENLLDDGEPCRDEIRIDATIAVATTNGAFADSFETVLVASRARLVTASVGLAPGELEGSFDVELSGLENGKISQNVLRIGFLPGGVSGSIEGMIESSDGEVATGGGLDYGHFPIESCESGHLIDADSAWGLTLSALVAAPVDFDLTWQNADATAFALDSEVTRICYDAGLFSDVETVTLELLSAARSDDDRIEGSWKLQAQVELDSAGEPATLHVFRNAYLGDTFAPAEFESRTGIAGFTFEASGRATFQFGYDVDLAAGTRATGVLTILQQGGSSCEEQPAEENDHDGGSSPGCSGNDFREIEQATLRESD